MSELVLRNHQRVRPINLRRLRPIAKTTLTELLGLEAYELGIHLVAAPEMTRLNERFLRHAGATDVIAFDYSSRASRFTLHVSRLHGEVFICLDEAAVQARRFRTTWQSELVRYLVHGLLHLRGFDDHRPAARRIMKREENRLLRELNRRFALATLAGRSRPARRVNRKS